jgi:hypothetical protein
MKQTKKQVISGSRREVPENCTLLGYYAANSGSSLPTFRGQLIGPIFQGRFLTLEDKTDRLSRNVGKKYTVPCNCFYLMSETLT